MSSDTQKPFRYKFKDFKGLFNKDDILGHTGFGLESAAHNIVWPVFVFYTILNEGYAALGSLSSISLLLAVIATFFIAKFVDKKTNLINDFGAILNTIVWICRYFIGSFLLSFYN